jgi:hypothetical protein
MGPSLLHLWATKYYLMHEAMYLVLETPPLAMMAVNTGKDMFCRVLSE